MKDCLATVELPDTQFVAANRDGRFSLSKTRPLTASLHQLAQGENHRLTQSLLNGALYAAQQRTISFIDKSKAFGLYHYVYSLVSNYHVTLATPKYFEIARVGAATNGHNALADILAEKIDEEDGHYNLAIKDLADLGYDAKALVTSHVPSRAQALVSLLEQFSRQPCPASCLGYAYTLERLAVFVDRAAITAVERFLPKGSRATRCLRVHSACGADASHVKELVCHIASFSSDEVAVITRAVYETMCVATQHYHEDEFDAEELRQLLDAYRAM